jgi:hypothetical protein
MTRRSTTVVRGGAGRSGTLTVMVLLDARDIGCVLFIGTQFSNLYTAVDTPARGRV